MKKYLLLGFIAVLSLFLTACEGVDLSSISDTDLQRISGAAVVCNEPYIRHGASCCLDQNRNGICDNDERAGNEPAREEPPAIAEERVAHDPYIDDDATLGSTNASVTIVEWSDYECPFCARFFSQTLPLIKSNYIDTGKVRFVYRDFPLSFHPNAQKAAEAAECAGQQGKYWEMHDKLFEEGVSGGITTFKQYAADLGLSSVAFNNCFDSGEMAAEVQKDFVDGQNAGVQGTPGFLINGRLISGAQPFQVFQEIIEAELRR